jgi:hypothetical protein
MPKKKLTDKMLKELITKLPEPVIDYWIKNYDKPFEFIQCHAIGFQEGVKYVLKAYEPHTERMGKILNHEDTPHVS